MKRFSIYSLGSIMGPYTIDEMAEKEILSGETLVCPVEESGMSAWHWRPARHFPELEEAFVDAPVALVPDANSETVLPAPQQPSDNHGSSPTGEEDEREDERDSEPEDGERDDDESPETAKEADTSATDTEMQEQKDYLTTAELPSLGGGIDEENVEVATPTQWVLVSLSMLVSAIYLGWRWNYTINYSTTWSTAVSMLLFGAEFFGWFSAIFYFAQVFKVRYRGPASITSEEALPTVDIFVAIYDEPVDILYKTLVGCKAMEYPKEKLKVYVLDDGNRPEVEKAAKALDCLYLTRSSNEGAKAGNINAALPKTHGEVIVMLDCDHIPVESFLTETIGFFNDEKVAWVQLPHYFYNPDCYQKNLHLEGELEHEQDLFFRVLMPGRDAVNSAIFAGSSTLMRREAIEEIGGCRIECAIEDLHTGMELHSRGWKSVFYPKTLSAGLSPESFRGLLTQRARWTRGGVQLFFKENPLFKSGLDFAQRMHYFSSILYFLHAIPRMIFVLAPLSFLIFQMTPIMAPSWKILAYFAPHYILSYLAFSSMSRGYRNPFWSDAYEVATVFSLFSTTIQTMLRPDKLIFNVTPKGETTESRQERLDWSFVAPHIIMLGLLVVGVIIASLRFAYGDSAFDAYALSGFWATFNIVLLGAAIEVARERPQQRDSYRLRRPFKAVILSGGKEYEGKSTDLSESGMGLMLPMKAHLDIQVRVVLHGERERTELSATVMRKDWTQDGQTRVGLRFNELSIAQKRSLLRQIYTRPGGWHKEPPEIQPMVEAFTQIASSSVRPRVRRADTRPRRVWPRIHAELKCRIESGRIKIDAETVDISRTGAAVRVPAGTRVPAEANFVLHGADGRDYHFDSHVIRIPKMPKKRWQLWKNSDSSKPDDIYGIRLVKPDHMDLAKVAKPFLERASVASH
jgi:cellulose synthase (UDP-forming)